MSATSAVWMATSVPIVPMAMPTFQSFGNLAASAIAGALWTLASPRIAFVYLAA